MSRIRVAALAAVLGLVVSANAEAQRYRFDFGVNGGGSWYSKMLDEEDFRFFDNINGNNDLFNNNVDVKYKGGWLGGAQATWWVFDWVGIRANGNYTERDVKVDFDDDFEDDFDDGFDGFDGRFGFDDEFGDVNLWSGTGDLLFRFRKPREDWQGFEWLPFLALGAGVKWQNPGGDGFTMIDPVEDKEWTGIPIGFARDTFSTRTFFLSELNSFLGLVGLGSDFRFAPNWAIRAEVGDRIWKPKIYEVEQATSNTFIAVNSDDNVSKTVHEIYGTLGLHVLFGLMPRPEVAVVAPPPEPAPAPAPAPAPREEALTICVIDPTAMNGIRMQEATYLVDRGDTVVTVGGQRRPFRESVGNPVVARNMDWYVRGQPLTMMVGKDKVEFVSYGSARTIMPTDLTFLGTINGLPIYAAREDVMDVAPELAELNRTRPGTDLSVFLNENRTLRTELEDVKVFYVPLDPVGCVFQAVQKQEAVRKTK